MMRKSIQIFVLIFVTLVLMLSGCIGGSSTTPPETPEGTLGGELPESVSMDIHLDPAIVEDQDSLLVSALVYEGLVSLDEDGVLQPSLATTWTVSDDGLDYIFELRPNVLFHSGAAFNADVVLDNFNRWFDPDDALHGTSSYFGWESLFLGFKGDVDNSSLPKSFYDGIEKVNDLTVLVHLNRQEPDLLEYLAQPYFYFVDPALLSELGSEYGTRADAVSGTGAYIVTSWTTTDLSLEVNTGYWGEIAEENVEFILH